MKFTSGIRVGVAALAVAIIAGCAGPVDGGSGDSGSAAESGDSFSWTYASYDPGTQAQMRAMESWAEDIPEVIDAGVDMEFFYSEALIDATDTLQAVGEGRADIAYLATAYFPAELPLGNIGGIPFLTSNAEAQSRTFMKLYEEYEPFREEFRKRNVHLLNVSQLGENIIAAQDPVPTTADLAGVSMRTYGQLEGAVALLDANPVALAQPEVYESLERGVISATSGASLDSAIARSYQEIAPHFIDSGTGNFALVANIMNLDTWNSLSAEQQDAINAYHEETWVDQSISEMVETEDAACEALAADNGTITIWTDEETADWENELGDTVINQWADQARDAGVDDPMEFYDLVIETYEEFLQDATYEGAMQRCAAQLG